MIMHRKILISLALGLAISLGSLFINHHNQAISGGYIKKGGIPYQIHITTAHYLYDAPGELNYTIKYFFYRNAYFYANTLFWSIFVFLIIFSVPKLKKP